MDSGIDKNQENKVLVLQGNLSLKYFNNTNQLAQYNRDIIPGEYEGGFKLWDCTIDFVKYMVENPQVFEGKRVL